MALEEKVTRHKGSHQKVESRTESREARGDHQLGS